MVIVIGFKKSIFIIIKQDKEIDSTTLVYSNKQRDYGAIIPYFALAKLVVKYGIILPYFSLKPYKLGIKWALIKTQVLDVL